MRYHPVRRCLDLEFVSGEVYRYDSVSRTTYQQLLRAPSKGSYFNRRIRDRHPFAKLT